MISKAVDFGYLLIEHYKSLNINEDELSVLLVLNHLIDQGNKLITADLLSLKMNLDIKKIDAILTKFFKKGLIEYKTINKETFTSIDPIKQELLVKFEQSLIKEKNENKELSIEEISNSLIQEFEKQFERKLSPVEKNKIDEWLAFGYSNKKILDALKESLSTGNKTLRNIDRILVMWSSRDDIENNGTTSINKNWNKNLEETIRIAKTPWLNEKNKK